MNRKRILEAARRFEELPSDYRRFDMSKYQGNGVERLRCAETGWKTILADKCPGTECGTVGCIAGHLALWYRLTIPDGTAAAGDCSGMERKKSQRLFTPAGITNAAGAYLGLKWKDSQRLFIAEGAYGGLKEVTALESAQALRNVAEHGDPLWRTITADRRWPAPAGREEQET